ncbi:pre-rRNA processing [Dimargaris cristalligena]|uniref:SPIN90/Ldb17 leucine-rich domain-containing protein n=1 Tax=Dimargaris cristalligena TaxID=215637 RepID=A0A4P9ZRZ3_9FUNG|nr:pre-rRNA processing [Dimargaris cristalligena]RKP35230.1 hypothetical protein BJ085DRAFT_36193 [Dimargaris cristalligena]|eukprot:RKP35230.1 hypothetical protein BJ085DRAFT_36193 [Dimargaris cristalligena]
MAAELTRKLSRRVERRYSVKAVSDAFVEFETVLQHPHTTAHEPYRILDAWVKNMDAQFSLNGGFTNPDCPHAFLVLLESPFFELNVPTFVSYILAFFQQKVTRRMAWVLHLLALGTQSLVPELLTLLVDHSAVARLKTYITRDYDRSLKFPALTLLTSLCLEKVLPSADFDGLDENFIAYLLYMIEKSRFSHEQINEAASKLILALHHQCGRRPLPRGPVMVRSVQKPTAVAEPVIVGTNGGGTMPSPSPSPSPTPPASAPAPLVENGTHHPSKKRAPPVVPRRRAPPSQRMVPSHSDGSRPCPTPPLRRPPPPPTPVKSTADVAALASPPVNGTPMSQRCVSASNSPLQPPLQLVIQTLCRERDSCLTFSENLIFMLNRESDRETIISILKFITALLTTPGTFTFFFTNDLNVLIDVIIRELYNLSCDADALRTAYLRLLPPIILNTQFTETRHKAAHLATLLRTLASRASLAAVSSEMRRLIVHTVKLCEDPLAYGPLL